MAHDINLCKCKIYYFVDTKCKGTSCPSHHLLNLKIALFTNIVLAWSTFVVDTVNVSTSFFFGPCSPTSSMTSLFMRFLNHTQWRTTDGRAPLDEWPARCTQHLQETDIHAAGGIQNHNLSRREAADLRLRERGHRDRQTQYVIKYTREIQ